VRVRACACTQIVATYTQAVTTIDPRRTVGSLPQLWTDFATYYASHGNMAAARAVYERAVRVAFRTVDELARVWCDWAELEMAHKYALVCVVKTLQASPCLSVCVCVSVCMYMYVCVHVRLCVHMCMCVCVHVFVFVCLLGYASMTRNDLCVLVCLLTLLSLTLLSRLSLCVCLCAGTLTKRWKRWRGPLCRPSAATLTITTR
jgi:hypothetical protein